MANYSFKTTGLPEPVNGIIEGHNLTQAYPHTKIYEGYSNLTFRNCNLHNCDLPPGSIKERCLHCHTSFCSHLHNNWLNLGVLNSCETNCEHVIDVDVLTVDGVEVERNYIREDKPS